MNQQNQIENPVFSANNQLEQEHYAPSSVEKKRALMMYFLFGIIIVVSNKKANEFEFFHLKQSMWWRMLFVLSILLSVVAVFIPIIKYLIIFWLTAIMTLFVIFARQAWTGKYYLDDSKYSLGLFPSLWSWLFGLFNMGFDWSDLVDSETGNRFINPGNLDPSDITNIPQVPMVQDPSNNPTTLDTNAVWQTNLNPNIDLNQILWDANIQNTENTQNIDQTQNIDNSNA